MWKEPEFQPNLWVGSHLLSGKVDSCGPQRCREQFVTEIIHWTVWKTSILMCIFPLRYSSYIPFAFITLCIFLVKNRLQTTFLPSQVFLPLVSIYMQRQTPAVNHQHHTEGMKSSPLNPGWDSCISSSSVITFSVYSVILHGHVFYFSDSKNNIIYMKAEGQETL